MNESMDRVLADWLREGPEMGPREGLERTLAATHRIGQRPGWTFPERWLPMQLTLARTPSLRPLLTLAAIALLVLALVAAALFVGSRPRLPEPFGPARNGSLVYEQGGNLLVAEGLTGPARILVDDSEAVTFPVFSNQGDRLAFVLGDGDGFDLVSVRPDGSDRRVLASFPGDNAGLSWSPTGDRLLMNFIDSGPIGFRLAVVKADGSGSRDLDVGRPADYASWRPDGRHIVFRGQLDDGTSGAFIANTDGTNVRQLPIPSMDPVDFEGLGWSPDGAHLGFMSDGRLGGTSGWQINIADIDTDGNLTKLHQLKMDPESTDERLPAWSPDSSQFAFLLEKDFKRHVAIAQADGSGMRLVGPETFATNILGYTWSPDGRTLLITEFPGSESEREAKRRAWSVDVATGEHREIQTFVRTWQRLAR